MENCKLGPCGSLELIITITLRSSNLNFGYTPAKSKLKWWENNQKKSQEKVARKANFITGAIRFWGGVYNQFGTKERALLVSLFEGKFTLKEENNMLYIEWNTNFSKRGDESYFAVHNSTWSFGTWVAWNLKSSPAHCRQSFKT